MPAHSNIPVILTFSGCDPSGGAGIQADIETISSMGCHTAPIITALTVQNTRQAKRFTTVDPNFIIDQAQTVLEDLPVAAIKIGMIGNTKIVEAIHTIIKNHPEIPVVYDPVLAAGGGGALTTGAICDAIVELLCPFTHILTPNSIEARALADKEHSLSGCATALMEVGCHYVLITGGHESTKDVVNILYGERKQIDTYRWSRLPHSYHGSGCTLSSAIAGLLAHNIDIQSVIKKAQEYTWDALKSGSHMGKGQHTPNRLFWARGNNNHHTQKF